MDQARRLAIDASMGQLQNRPAVFAEPFALSEPERIEDGEQRWRTLGVVEGHALLLVAHTSRDEEQDGQALEVIRIISARAADRTERRRYEQESR
ncbi:MAG: BrnT family toxin [Geminicoccaceae bacterium]